MTWWSSDEYERFRTEILGDIEDDALGVYEAWWTANTRFPTRSVSERLALAEALVGELIANGLVRLYRGRWIGPSHERHEVSDGEVGAVLLAWATWVPQEDDVVWMDRAGR